MLMLHNSLTRRKEPFEPLRKDEVTMYNCGPTVYDYAHIGNFRSYVVEDLLRRYLEYKRYRVREVMNITDVGHMTSDSDYGEDRMEVAAKREKKTPEQIARHYEQAFFRDIAALNIKQAWKYPRATEHIDDMITLVEKLIETGYAYVSNQSVYYDVTKFSRYGQLSGNTLEKLKAGARIEVNPDKKNPWDFALWIYDPNHLMRWESPWNDHGYPGWHLECSVMSMKYLGESIDIHSGGEDNKFPHHESEIAQSEAVTGRKFVKYWLHVKHLVIQSEKMSKSKGNYYTLQDLLKKGYSWKAVRYLLLSAYYRQQLNFTLTGLASAQSTVSRLDEFVQNVQFYAAEEGKTRERISRSIAKAKEEFENALDDDLNISLALGAVHDFIREMNKVQLNRAEAEDVLALIFQFDQVLGLDLRESTEKQAFPEQVSRLVEKREEARHARDFEEADRIREELKARGFRVEDTPQGPKVTPIAEGS